jgi:aminopeptidase N
VSAYEIYATAEGFFEASQDELTAEYVQRFFIEMPATASHRTGWALARTAVLSYPMSSTNGKTLGYADTALRSQKLDSGLRRAFVDGTDQLRRAVKSLSSFPGT